MHLKTVLAGFSVCAVLSAGICIPAAASGSEEYGSRAYGFLETIAADYPQRINDENNRTQADNDMGLWIASQLESFGYTVESQDYVHFDYTGTNYYVTKPGRSDSIVCIGAHYDCVDTAGIDDNGSGVSVLLELAERFKEEETPCTLNFVFFDNEEHGGFVGSYNYVNYVLKEQELLDRVLCYINIDSVGGGDRLHAYGGVYDEDDALQQLWAWNLANGAAKEAGIDLYALPAQVAQNRDSKIAFRTPTRTNGSDHYYFMDNGIPYVYFEAGLWCDEDGRGGNHDTVLTCHYQTADPAFRTTGGQIMHTPFDNMDRLNELLPGRLQTNLSHTSEIISGMLQKISDDSPEQFTAAAYYPGAPHAAGEDESVPETESALFSEASSEMETAAIERSGTVKPAHRTEDIILSNHKGVLAVFCLMAAIILVLIGIVIYGSVAGKKRRRKKRRKR